MLYSFCAQTNCTDGASPVAGLVQSTDGNFYGTTRVGGTKGAGTVFKVTAGGTLTTLYSFCINYPDCSDGYSPNAGLLQASDGDFYGTTTDDTYDCAFCGTVFKITHEGTLTTLHSFSRGDGANPYAGLIQATDGNLYGTTYAGGVYGLGTVFQITSGGTLTTMHNFDDYPDGGGPFGGLLQATSGNFYGTTEFGGFPSFPDGTVFGLSVGLGPFVETLPSFGKVGSKIAILGTGLTGATGVRFNGTAATFTVVSSTEIKTTVPTGATSGMVQVTTPSGTLTSNVVFRVKQ